MKGRLPHSAENPIAAAIRKAIGVSDTAPVTFSARDIARKKHWPSVKAAPAGMAEFSRLFDLTGVQLRELGCGNWDGGLFLFPVEWYDYIPKGFPCETISGKTVSFEPGKTPNDVGFGMLAYGVRIGPAQDEE